MTVAFGVMTLMLVFIVPRFKDVFGQLSPGQSLPGFTLFVFNISDVFRHNFPIVLVALVAVWFAGVLAIRTGWAGARLIWPSSVRRCSGQCSGMLAIARFTRTLGTLVTSGVPILQALTIVKEAAGNVIVGRLAEQVRTAWNRVKASPARCAARTFFPRWWWA